MNNENKRLVKRYLADKGIKILQKDIKAVTVKEAGRVFHRITQGNGEYFNHRDIYTVDMKDGTRFEFMRETVDENGEYSTNSAMFVTRDVTTRKRKAV